MATPDRQTPAHNQTSISSVKSTLRAYHVPLLFLMAALFCQFVVLPSNFPPTHYDVLGIPKYSSIEEVTRAYEKITSKWNSSVLVPPAVDFIKSIAMEETNKMSGTAIWKYLRWQDYMLMFNF